MDEEDIFIKALDFQDTFDFLLRFDFGCKNRMLERYFSNRILF